MDEFDLLERADPVDRRAVECALSDPVFDELFHSLVADRVGNSVEPVGARRFRARLSAMHHWRLPAAAVAAVVVVIGTLAGVGVIGGGGGLSRPFTTSWKAATPFAPANSGGISARRGTWRLVDDLLSGTWQQNVYGPGPGFFSCSPDETCYVLAGQYPSARAGTPLLSETLYVSTDDGATWSALPVPPGLVPTTALKCSGPLWCATGATYNGQPVLAVTRDGGHSFTINPLPSGAGTFHALSCPSTDVCEGLVSTSSLETTALDATFLVTDDGGATFNDESIVPGNSMIALSCTSSTDCTAVGSTDATVGDLLSVAVSAVTSDQGRTWSTGTLPAGFGISAGSTSLVCADALHCFVTGSIPIAIQKTHCGSLPAAPQSTSRPTSTAISTMSPQVASISKTEAKLAAAAAEQEYLATHVCSDTNAPFTQVGDVASSSTGGLSWTPEALPADVPRPELDGLSCPTATECWTAGQEEVAQHVRSGTDMDSAVLIGTTDGGSTWSKVVFSVPVTAPNATGQSYQTIGSVTCPTTRVCLARGAAAQGSRYAPVYSLIVPGN